MMLRLRAALLMCLMAGAVFTGAEACRSLRREKPAQLPLELMARLTDKADSAAYYVRDSGDYVAVFHSQRDRQPLSVTSIEMSALRSVDQEMVRRGIPVEDRRELLRLLEDLGS